MHDGARASRWQAVFLALSLFMLNLSDASSAETEWSWWKRPNATPVITGMPTTSIGPGQGYSFRPSATDADGDRLWFFIRNQPRWAKFDPRTGELRGTPTGAGDYADIVIGVSDWRSSAMLPRFTIKVGAAVVLPNQPPSITGTPPAAVTAGQAYAFQPTASDPEGTRLSFRVQNCPTWARFDATTGRLAGTPASTQTGTYSNIVVSATDGSNLASLAPFAIQVTAPANRAPVISGTPATTVVAGQAYSFTPSASDADGDPLTFSAPTRPAWASFDPATGRLSGTPGAGNVGSTTGIVLSVSDGRSSSSLPAFSVQVTETPNRGPLISGTPVTRVVAAQAYSFTPVASDPDGDRLSFAIRNRPSWANFDAGNGRLSGTPSAQQVGAYPGVVVSVTDGETFAELAPFAIEVTSAPNRAPAISGTPPTTVVAGQAYSFAPTASDADGDPLTFSAPTRPAWANFDPVTGRLSGTPGATHVGTTTGIVLSVSDGKSSSSLPAFSLQVTAAPNRAPTITGTPATSVTAGQVYAFTPAATDADGDALVFSIQNRPAWASFTASNGRLSGTPATAAVGPYSGIVISVSDGKTSTALAPFAIQVVAAANRAPTLSGSPPSTVRAGEPYGFAPNASDPDGDPLSFTITGKPGWANFNPANGQLTGTPTASQVGFYNDVVISVTDGRGASASLPAFTVRVEQSANGAVTLSWRAPTANENGTPLTDLQGFQVHYGRGPGQYTQSLSLPSPSMTSVTIEDLAPATWYFAVKAVNSAGVQSNFSNEASKTIP